jgi:hypothetical protein
MTPAGLLASQSAHGLTTSHVMPFIAPRNGGQLDSMQSLFAQAFGFRLRQFGGKHAGAVFS